ncbi:MAG: 3-dehydroquinate synthase [Selenomonas sp.]|nr:3-dehydroquinate synthase [Selenomonas sp.]
MDVIEIKSKLYDYSVEFTDDFAGNLKEFPSEKTVYLVDSNILQLYRAKLAGIDGTHIYVMEADEHKKNMDTVMDFIAFMQRLGVRKDWRVVCFGGGISQDIATTAGCLYLRNVDWCFFPTTLLSMCDSCIGGKSGINVGEYKNQIGVFYPPKKIFIDVQFIETLSEDDYLNGWGELLKFSLTEDPAFYESVKQEKTHIPCANIREYIRRGLAVKQKVIEQDEFESDLRRILNYGHTFGHALEAYTCNAVPHGKGVIWGIDIANYLAVQEGLIDRELYLDVKHLIKKAFLKEEIKIREPEKIFAIIKTDKKVRDNSLSFALLDGKSHLCVHPMMLDEKLLEHFKRYLGETHAYYLS